MPASIEVSRNTERKVDRRRTYQVVIDGKVFGKIRNGETLAFEVTPGRHELHLKIDWARSPPVAIVLAEDGRSIIRCWSHARPITAPYWITFGRSRYIGLELNERN